MATDLQDFSSINVFLTPLVREDVYGSTLEVTKNIDLSDLLAYGGIDDISVEVDDGDFTYGVFTYGEVNMRGINFDGKFNSINDDYRSLFPYIRDLAKVEVTFKDQDQNERSLFRGFINEEATQTDFRRQTVSMTVLSFDAFARKSVMLPGIITNGIDLDEALNNVLKRPELSSILNYNPANINPKNGTPLIDNAPSSSGKTFREVINELLFLSNSVLEIDSDDNMIVRSRDVKAGTPSAFFGSGNLEDRENIIDIFDYNDGLQRSFNSVRINKTTVTDNDYEDRYKLRQLKRDIDLIENQQTLNEIALDIVDSLKAPKKELKIKVKTSLTDGIELLSSVTVDYNARIYPKKKDTLDFYDVHKYGTARYAATTGNFHISGNVIFKVIGIQHDLEELETTLKLREV